MRRAIPGVLACWLAACGFQGSAAPPEDDAPVIDAPPGTVDGSPGDAPPLDGGAVAKTCMQRWFDHQPMFDAPSKITELSTGANERDPWISQDGQRLYFAREPGNKGASDIYLAQRAMNGGPFGTPMPQDNLNTNGQESRAALSNDELILVLASDRGGSFQTWITRRNAKTDPLGSPNQDGLAMVNGPNSQTPHYDPYLTNGGKTLYYAPDPPGAEQQHIWFATRATVEGTFGPPAKVPGINGDDKSVNDSDPALSADERILVFASTRPGSLGVNDLYYATRASAGVNFGPVDKIPGVSTNSDDGDPMLSDDGCDLYFSSTRAGNYDLYVAHMAQQPR